MDDKSASTDGNVNRDKEKAALEGMGFNTEEARGEHSYHVQTEVCVKDGIVVRTIVARKGHVLDVRSTNLERDGVGDVVSVGQIVERQHGDAVSDVKRGRFDGGQSE